MRTFHPDTIAGLTVSIDEYRARLDEAESQVEFYQARADEWRARAEKWRALGHDHERLLSIAERGRKARAVSAEECAAPGSGSGRTAVWTAKADQFSVILTGPRLDDQARDLAERIADAVHPDDDLHDRWQAFATARRNRLNAQQCGIGVVGLKLSAERRAWEALAPDLPAMLWLSHDDARTVAGALDETSGRVGAVAP